MSFEGVEGESLLAAVRPHLAVSTGSACTSASQEPSYVLRALGRSERLSESSLRFGLGRFTQDEDIDVALRALQEMRFRALRRIAGALGMKYNEITRRYFEAAPSAGMLGGRQWYTGGPRAIASRAPGCNSICKRPRRSLTDGAVSLFWLPSHHRDQRLGGGTGGGTAD